VVFKKTDGIEIDGEKISTVYVEMKNKHNTMNSSSSAKTYMKMQGQLLSDNNCACFLVEIIAKRSQNIPWIISLDGQRQQHRRIRRVSIDKFYELVTGEADAFYNLCMELPEKIKQSVIENGSALVPQDTVFAELKNSSTGSFELALYMLGFESYFGFNGIH
ncbi:MAG: Eco47II family restriction endonuclease, partial [Selenomonadaceae bacterium]|nr:Eco47II family restriction endonuclease [Selenomonadaceae bacterium]